MELSRREFCQKGIKSVGAGVVAGTVPFTLSCANPNRTIVVGAIGVRNMGWANLRTFLENENVVCGAICDVDQKVLSHRAGEVEKKTGARPKLYKDYRKLLEQKDIDAVIIATPDHWHCLMAIHAMEAGKHVFVEKPMANSITECLLMEEAVQRYKKILTVNQWQNSGSHWQEVLEIVRSGRLGKMSRVRTWSYTGKTALPVVADGTAPDYVDYEMWLGPAPHRPFNKNRFHYNFRYYFDYASGLMGDWGAHMLDFALQGLEKEVPQKVQAMGGKYDFPDDARETPDTMNVLYDFGDCVVTWEHSIGLRKPFYPDGAGVIYQGRNASLFVSRGSWWITPEKGKEDLFSEEETKKHKGTGGHDEHVKNFIQCVRKGWKSRKLIACDVTKGKNVAVMAHLGNVAFRTGEQLVWDPVSCKTQSEAANKLLMPNYRSPWELPKL